MRAVRRARARRLLVVASSVSLSLTLASAVLFACRVTPLDVGNDRAPPQEASDTPSPPTAEAEPPEAAPTLEQRLRARCAEEPGRLDEYFSAAELTARLVGRWFNCGKATASSFQDGDGDGIAFLPDGRWAFLFFSPDRASFVPTWSTPQQNGVVRYYFSVDSEAGAAADSGIASGNVPIDDTSSRTPLVVYLDRGGTPDGNNLTFSKNPRQMTVVESGSSLRARYVPID